MARFLWACFDGGGNVPPSLGIARALAAAGHDVTFVGRPEMVDRVRRAGFTAITVESAYVDSDAYAWHPRGPLFAYLTSPHTAEEVLSIAASHRPDVMIIDAMFGAVLAEAGRFGVPTAAMLHTFLHRTIDGWHVMMAEQSDARVRAGFDPIPGVETLWAQRDLFHVNALERFDAAPRLSWPNIRHGGPILEHDSRALPVDLPWAPTDPTPLVVVSFSTAVAQSSVGKLQRTFDAVADLPVHVVATTAAVDPARLRVPANVFALPFAAHDPLIRAASLVITHGGHGTVMRALHHGVNVVCVTGQAADQDGVAALDQPRVAEFLEEHRVGRRVDADAPTEEIRAAIREVLGGAEYRENVARAAEALRGVDGAAIAAERVLALLPGRSFVSISGERKARV